MIRRLYLLVAALLSVLVTHSAAQAVAPQRIVAVGDLHGDFAAWQAIARAAHLVDVNGHWSGGATILVQMGDVTDREPDSLKIIKNIQQLQKEASRVGGRVVVILGNHEAMNLLGDNRYTTAGEYAAFVDRESESRRERVYEANRARLEAFYRTKDPTITPEQVRLQWMAEHPLGWIEHTLAWKPTGELGRWATGNPAILKIGDTLFAHGGISAEYARQPLASINDRVAKAMAGADDGPTSILSDALGPLWYRGLAAADPDAAAERAAMKPPSPPLTHEQELDAVLSSYRAKRLVIAHTPNLAGIMILDGGRLARIDTGISRYYGGPLSWLEILGDAMVAHTTPRTS